MTEEPKHGEVITPVFGEPGLLPKERSYENRCRHRRLSIDQEHRLVECKECGAEVDPFDVLWDYAVNERQLYNVEKRRKELYEELNRLKREERNTKARLRRAKKAGN